MDLTLLYKSITQYEKATSNSTKKSSMTFIVHNQTCITVTISRDCRLDGEENGNVKSNFIVKKRTEKGKDEV